MEYCTRCGEAIQPGKSFCTRCGDPVRPPAERAAQPDPWQQQTQQSYSPPQGFPGQQAFPGQQGSPPPQDFSPPPPGSPPPQQGFSPPGFPSGAAGPGGPPGPGGSPRRSGRFRWAAVAGIILAAVAAGAIVAAVVVGFPTKHTGASSSPSASGRPASSGPPAAQSSLSQAASSQSASSQASTGPAAEQTAAQNLSQLLTQSISDRSKIVSAFNDVDTCGPGLAGDTQTFQQAAASRQSLLSQLGTLPDASALPPQLIQSLTSAWQASVAADQDYAGWASDENSHGCRPNDTADAHYQATVAPNQQATTDKTTFVGLWNPIATKYSLPTYQQDQL